MQKQKKYEKVIKWIDTSPNQEFLALEIRNATGVSRPTTSLILPILCKAELLERRELNRRVIFYKKTANWATGKAIETNHQRLKEKWQRYQSKN